MTANVKCKPETPPVGRARGQLRVGDPSVRCSPRTTNTVPGIGNSANQRTVSIFRVLPYDAEPRNHMVRN